MEPWKLRPARDIGLSPTDRLRSVRRESGLVETASHLVWWKLVGTYLRLAHRVTVIGGERLRTEAPLVLVANHASHLDAIVLAAQLPAGLRARTHPIAAMDTFFDSTVHSVLAAATVNALPVERGRAGPHALADLRRRLIDDRCVFILFPEGTRSRDGSMGPFKPGVGMLLAGTDVRVIPCHLSGTFEALPPDRHFPRAGPIRLTIGQPMCFAEVSAGRQSWNEIAGRLEAAVRQLGGGLG